MTTAMTKTNIETGEITRIEPFDRAAYLSSLDTAGQQALARAYDEACAALIGPNDVQKESGREFKKKSAWRKLARHFGISTAVVTVAKEFVGDVFLASVTVKASGPWGQSSDAIGACATDEATGRRVITMADALATAETRATNRAVSNLIAMGEVSAEEIGDRKPMAAPKAKPVASSGNVGEFLMPFGKTKGTRLADMKAEDLKGALTWAEEKNKFEEFQAAARAVLGGSASFADKPAALEGEDDEWETLIGDRA